MEAPPPPAPAGLGLRLAARLVDLLLILSLECALIALLSLAHAAGMAGVGVLGAMLLAGLLGETVYLAYFLARGRRTLGYFAAGLRAETLGGEPLGPWRSLARALLNSTLGKVLAIGLIDMALIALTRSKRAGHDLLAGTRVVRGERPRFALAALSAVMGLLIVATFLSHRPLQSYYAASGSMLNTLRPNERLLANTLFYRAREPRAGEIVLFVPPPEAEASPGDEFIMRVVGAPGDVVFSRGRKFFRNGRLLHEPYVRWSSPEEGFAYAYDMKVVGGRVYSRDLGPGGAPDVWRLNGVPIREVEQVRIEGARPEPIPPGRLLLLGDHRNAARDSHEWGLAPRDSLVGRAMAIFWPLTRFRSL